MPTSAQLKQKATGFVQSIRSMSDKERSESTSVSLAKDYNRLRELVEQVHPDLKEVLPPCATFYDGGMYGVSIERVTETHNDLGNFCQQIVNLLP